MYKELTQKYKDNQIEVNEYISSIEKGRTYVVGFTLQHSGFAQMRQNGCTRLQSTDASHMKSLLGGTCFGT